MAASEADSPERLRLFFALSLPPALRAALAQCCDQMRQRAERLQLRARFVSKQQMHLTLKFVGSVAEVRRPELVDLLRDCCAETPVVITRPSALVGFPSIRRARVVVASVTDPHGEIAALARRLDAGAVRLGFSSEARRFRPHVTVARLGRPLDCSRLVGGIGFPPIAAGLNRAHLVSSTLHPTGSRYKSLATVGLRPDCLENS